MKISIEFSKKSVCCAMCGVFAIVSAVFIFIGDFMLPLEKSPDAGCVLGLALPFLFEVALCFVCSMFDKITPKMQMIICAISALAIGVKYSVNFLCAMSFGGIWGISAAYMNVIVVAVMHLVYAAFVLAFALIIAKALNFKRAFA